jgi:hypothetical protein
LSLIYRWTTERSKRIEPSSKSPSNSKVSISQRSLPGHKAGFARPSLHLKFSFPAWAETGSMTGWWVASLSPTTSTIQPLQPQRSGNAPDRRFCGHFSPANSLV